MNSLKKIRNLKKTLSKEYKFQSSKTWWLRSMKNLCTPSCWGTSNLRRITSSSQLSKMSHWWKNKLRWTKRKLDKSCHAISHLSMTRKPSTKVNSVLNLRRKHMAEWSTKIHLLDSCSRRMIIIQTKKNMVKNYPRSWKCHLNRFTSTTFLLKAFQWNWWVVEVKTSSLKPSCTCS